MYRTLLFCSFLAACLASMAMQQAKLGEKVVISLGKGIKTVQRSSKDGDVFLKACDASDNSKECTQWKSKDGKFVTGGSPVRLLSNGDLVFEKTTEADFASYSNPDEKEIVTAHADGSFSAVLGPVISLVEA